MYGEPYWDESHAYEFSLAQVEQDIEAPTQELHQMCLEVVDRVVKSEALLHALHIPSVLWDFVAQSWRQREMSLYGRFDLRYDGKSPAKLYEYNADTPTSLYEAAFFQWLWLEESMQLGVLPPAVDQYNLLQEKLIDSLGFFNKLEPLYLSCVRGTEEDRGTVQYIEDCARQAGLLTHFIYVEDIGADSNGQFCDLKGQPIRHLFKLYPWEWMFSEEYATWLPRCDTHFYEPAWKSILSNKGMLALLWQFFEGHPNLLPCFFADDKRIESLNGNYARKPFFSREGANIQLIQAGQTIDAIDGPYGVEPVIFQGLCEPPRFDDVYTIVGSWVIGDTACGMGIREDTSRVTRDLSRFVPHFIA